MSAKSGLAELLDLLDERRLEVLPKSRSGVAQIHARYVIELSGEALHGGNGADWMPVDSYNDPWDAVRGCSDFVNTLKSAVGVSVLKDIPVFARVLRVSDSKAQKLVLWGEDDGALHYDPAAFEKN